MADDGDGRWEDDGFGNCSDAGHSVHSSCQQSSASAVLEPSVVAETPAVTDVLDSEMAEQVNSAWESALVTARAKLSTSKLDYIWQSGFAARVLDPKGPWTTEAFDGFSNKDRSFASTAVVKEFLLDDVADTKHKEFLSKQGGDVLWPIIATRIEGISWEDQETHERDLALAKWKRILQLGPQHCKMGRKLVCDLLLLKTDADLLELLNNLFARKSTNTLHKRADALFRFISYCWNTSREPFPISLGAVYAYVNSLKAEKPSAAQGFREALNFSFGLLGLDNADVCAQDPLIQGAAFAQLLKKRIRVQATIPTVKGLARFLECICDSGSVIDVVFLGFCCLCITLRSRWNDAQ